MHALRSDTGEPASGEPVVLLPEEAVPYFSNATEPVGRLGQALPADAQGRCVFRLPAGHRSRALPKEWWHGHPEAEVWVGALEAGETREVNVTIPVFWHWLRVEDATSGAAIRGVHAGRGGKEALTDADGLAGLWWSDLRADQVSVEAEGYGPALVGVQRGHETPQSAFVVRLSCAGCLRGRVLGASDQPIGGAEVEVVARGQHLARTEAGSVHPGGFTFLNFEDRSWSASTDAEGAFRLCGLSPSIPLQVTVSKNPNLRLTVRDPVKLAPGEEREVDYRLLAGAVVLGVVRDEAGLPVPNCLIWLKAEARRKPSTWEDDLPDRSVSSDDQGRFEILDVSPGEWELGPAPTSGYLPTPVAVHVPVGAARVEVVLELRAGLFVAGRVVGPDGLPVTNVTVMSNRGPNGESRADGSFRIGPLEPGKVTLNVWSFASGLTAEPLEVQAGEEDVLLRLEPGGAITGHLVDVSGGPVGGFATLSEEGAGFGTIMFSTVAADGEFTFDGLRPGSYGVSARSAEGGAGSVQGIKVSGSIRVEEVSVRLAPGGQLALRFPTGEGNRAYRVRSGDCLLHFDSVGAEESVTPHLPAGAVTVELHAPGGALLLTRETVVRAGETLLVDMSKEP